MRDYEEALGLIDKSINRNYTSSTARHLKAIILRKMERHEEAISFIDESLRLDTFNLGCIFEQNLNNVNVGKNYPISNEFNTYAEYALDYADAGCYQEAGDLLKLYQTSTGEPMLYYYLGWFSKLAGDNKSMQQFFSKAAQASPDYCFPSKTEEVLILKSALQHNINDSKAYYYLGNYWFANSNHEEAIKCWERSVEIDDSFPTVLRNLALACYNKLRDPARALSLMEKAFALSDNDSRLLMELDLLHKLCNYSPWTRLRMLEDHPELVQQRNDLYMERLSLYNQLGDFETAKALIADRKFQPWEGGEGKIVMQFTTCHIELAKQAIEQQQPATALALLDALAVYPDNLGEGKLPGKPENDIFYWKGLAYEMLNNQAAAIESFQNATKGDTRPMQAVFYNDPQPDNIFYQGKAWQKLDDDQYAQQLFSKLIQFGKEHLRDKIRIDYFAVSLPELMVFDSDLDEKNTIHCFYMMGLGYLGQNNKEQANECFREVLSRDVNHLGALTHLNNALL
jgi:tetratricopeptide (TPR) repeat protein